MALETSCDFAKVRYVEIGRLRNMWGMLVFILGATFTLFLVVSILLFIRSSWLPGAIALLGTIVNGATISWITAQRKTAAEEDQKAFEDLVKTCGAPIVSIPLSGISGFAAPSLPAAPIAGLVNFAAQPKSYSLPTEVKTDWFEKLEAARKSGAAAKSYLASLRGGS